jgi:hypothetical protein
VLQRTRLFGCYFFSWCFHQPSPNLDHETPIWRTIWNPMFHHQIVIVFTMVQDKSNCSSLLRQGTCPSKRHLTPYDLVFGITLGSSLSTHLTIWRNTYGLFFCNCSLPMSHAVNPAKRASALYWHVRNDRNDRNSHLGLRKFYIVLRARACHGKETNSVWIRECVQSFLVLLFWHTRQWEHGSE